MTPPTRIRTLLSLGLLALAPLTGCAASRGGFDGVVSAVQQHYSVRAQRMPLMGFVSLCARISTGGGVKAMQMADFEHFSPNQDPAVLENLIAGSIGDGWQRFIAEREAGGELSLIFARPDGDAMNMLIANYDHGELQIIRMDLNGARLQHWMQNPAESARHGGEE
jgi:hypothetical protein